MKLSLLELVQRTLSSMDSDRVDSIDETEESVQVAELARDIYYEMLNDAEWPFLNGAIATSSPSDPANPTALNLGDEVRRISTISYDIAAAGADPEFLELDYQDPVTFARLRSKPGDDKVLVTIGDNLKCYVDTNRKPDVWTSFDDGTIYFDAVDQVVDTVIQPSKVLVIGFRIPEFIVQDEFVPVMPAHFFPLYLAELRKASFGYFKNSSSPRDQAVSISQRAQVRRLPNRTGPTREARYFNTHYGRRR